VGVFWALSELADWWNTQKEETESLLEQWVYENPQWWAIGVAGVTQTAIDMGAGMVDALRFGEGAAEGGWKGYGKDGLRMLVFLGTLMRAGGLVGRIAQTRSIRLAVVPARLEGPCTFVAGNNAATMNAGKARNLFLTARDAAKALGTNLSQVPRMGRVYQMAAWIDELLPFLVRNGVRFKQLGFPRQIDDVVRAAERHDGVIIFAIRWISARTGAQMSHSMIAVRTASGVRFADYGGKFMKSLSDLNQRGAAWASHTGYEIATNAGMGQMVLIEGMKMIGALDRYANAVFRTGMIALEGVSAIETPEGVELAFPVAVAAGSMADPAEAEIVKQSFQVFKDRANGSPPAKLWTPLRTAPRIDQLTGIQYRLNALGFGAGPVDGAMGPRTTKAISAFQRENGLRADGVPGPKTQSKLKEILGET
jgi:hypothetical protein